LLAEFLCFKTPVLLHKEHRSCLQVDAAVVLKLRCVLRLLRRWGSEASRLEREFCKGDNEMEAVGHDELIMTLKNRFAKNRHRHTEIDWSSVQARLESIAEKLQALSEMERTGGEPDVVGRDEESGEFIFCDCSPESPIGRRSLCYDREALDSRKENKPSGNAIEVASSIGIEMLTEQQYRELQKLGEFDRKTSSWVKTPAKIRDLGGALFCDRRYDHVFVYHNGAEAYYAARGFRGRLKV
jgi:hypothetical protein